MATSSKPSWYDQLSDEAKADFDATDWSDNFLDDEAQDTLAVYKSSRQLRRE